MRSFSHWMGMSILVVVAGAVYYLKSESGVEIAQLRVQMATLEQRLRHVSNNTVAPATGSMKASVAQNERVREMKDGTGRSVTSASLAATTTREQALLDELLARAGAAAGSVRVDDLRAQPVAVASVSQHLLETFSTSPLAAQGFVTDTGCTQSVCAVEVTFNDARAAMTLETQLLRWLSEANGNCGFTMNPAPLASATLVNVVRRVSIDCG